MVNINLNAQESESQKKSIARWLEHGRKITPLDALRLVGCFRLAARICELRRSGMKIKTTMVRLRNGKRVAEYSL